MKKYEKGMPPLMEEEQEEEEVRREIPKISRKPRETGIVTPTPTEMSVYHCPYWWILHKRLPWYFLHTLNFFLY